MITFIFKKKLYIKKKYISLSYLILTILFYRILYDIKKYFYKKINIVRLCPLVEFSYLIYELMQWFPSSIAFGASDGTELIIKSMYNNLFLTDLKKNRMKYLLFPAYLDFSENNKPKKFFSVFLENNMWSSQPCS